MNRRQKVVFIRKDNPDAAAAYATFALQKDTARGDVARRTLSS